MARQREDEYEDEDREDDRPRSRSRRDEDDFDDEPRERRPARRRGGGDGFECPFCGSTEEPTTQKKISTGGWIVFAVLLLVCWPLFWIGLLMKEDVTVCYDCGRKISG